ncbi:hypothetical protein CWB99_22045 [Pseudoalteromonas rubra]|uniref:Uncharacterized protein n=1 Tax=Pseudoalteromonas rubra TaxID=43658 RepID=A0A5S3WFH6_9GAMM|nr:hypothetical protein CWB99_22045 [Pseudoalteromonas rubra]TMP33331.1 hypothetical protein CWC00_11195 [Pseudoalteromonas rubra]
MNNITVTDVDLAKDVFQICTLANNQVRSHAEMIPREFTPWITNQSPSTVVFEACVLSNC